MNAIVKTGSLADTALLVSLNISQWTARRFDSKASKAVTEQNGANASAARVNKQLISHQRMGVIASAVNEARAAHDMLTLPWGARGVAILPTRAFMDYRAKMAPLRSKFEDAARAFCADYPALRDEAKADLGDLFKLEDYPNAEDIARRFSFSVSFSPVPTGGDFRVAVRDDILAEIREEIEATTQEAGRAAVRDIYRRAHEVASRMAEKLKEYRPATDGEKASGVFRDSLVENVRELADVLPRLNLFGDIEIDAMAESLRALASNDATTLRESDAVRSVTQKEAARLAEIAGAFL